MPELMGPVAEAIDTAGRKQQASHTADLAVRRCSRRSTRMVHREALIAGWSETFGEGNNRIAIFGQKFRMKFP